MITLRIDEREPPSGEVMTDAAAGAAFSGWLDLLRVLSEALMTPEHPPADGPPRP